jgi:two-component system nitrogen regulation sensor histidine kinase GlnL
MGRRKLTEKSWDDTFTYIGAVADALALAAADGDNEVGALRFDAWLKRTNRDVLPVHVIVSQTGDPNELVVELLPIEQQSRQEREERLLDQSQANKELIRNLAHEIKNPLGGIRSCPKSETRREHRQRPERRR